MTKNSVKVKTEFGTWIVRLLVGGTFVFSGFVKAIDPWGLLYKLEEYLDYLSFDIWPNLQLVGVFGLSALEFLIGIFLCFGCFRKSVVYVGGAVMLFMLPLTLWIAISDPVKDCGCFGDAVILSNWTSFWKNIILTGGFVWLIKYNRQCSWLITPALQWLVFVFTAVFILVIEFYGYVSQPLLDFRPYKNGMELVDNTSAPDEQYVFIYERNGERIEVNEDDTLPDENDGWKFVDRKISSGKQNIQEEHAAERNFRVWSQNGDEDVTEEVLNSSGKELIVMMPDLSNVSPATTWKLNSLYEWSIKHGVEMIGVVSATEREIQQWEDISMASYEIYTSDDTQIKEVVRGNPGIVYLIDGIIVWKSTLGALNIDDFMSPEISDDARNFGRDNRLLLRNIVFLYMIFLVGMVFLSFLPKIKNYYFKPSVKVSQNFQDIEKEKQEEAKHDDKVHHE